mmetsp:Transcript_11762/g.12924  ORF Transcript_11762/g.12924 Transcript_11762/m.12924 type:complete len:255 (+) Transcript_11762:53-817(+)
MGEIISSLTFQPPLVEYTIKSKSLKLLKTSRGHTIPCIWYDNKAKYTIIFSHGNAEDFICIRDWIKSKFLQFVNVNCLIYEYTGYTYIDGVTEGVGPSEENVFADVDATYQYAINELKIPSDRIIMFGRSLGSGPSCYIASKYKIRGVILHSPIASIFRVMLNFRFTMPGDKFCNVDRVKQTDCPVFVIHGSRDEIVSIDHARELHRNSKVKYPLYVVKGAQHNNVELFSNKYYEELNKFLNHLDSLESTPLES